MSLASDLEQLLDLHRQYHALAQVTVGLLGQDNYEALDDAWSKRRELFKRLTKARSKLTPFFADWPRILSDLAPNEQEHLNRMVESIESVGKETLELDQKASGLLESIHAQTKQNLQHLQKGRKVLKAYHQSAQQTPSKKLISKS